jgi:hypothetical protein
MLKHTLKGEYPSRRVWLDGKELSPARSQEYFNHSPDGFNWGYGGSGAAQLALAIMLELINDPGDYQAFKWRVIAPLALGQSFEIEFEILMEER